MVVVPLIAAVIGIPKRSKTALEAVPKLVVQVGSEYKVTVTESAELDPKRVVRWTYEGVGGVAEI
jgi:hypothetical protein